MIRLASKLNMKQISLCLRMRGVFYTVGVA